MKMLGNEAIMFTSGNNVATKAQKQISSKVSSATLKSFYESKIASLSDHTMPPHLLRIMCQDVPVKNDNLESRWGHKCFVRKCLQFYQGKLKEIEHSEKRGFFSFF